MQKWLDNILTYFTHNEGKQVIAERCIKTLTNFSYLIPSHLLETNEFLGNISQLKFLVMTEKNTFV